MSEDVQTEWPEDRKWTAGTILLKSRTVSASEISARLEITPDRQFERGSLMSPRNPTGARRKNSVWALESGLANDSDLTDHVRALIGLVDGCREELARLATDCELTLSLGFGSENGQGGCVLPADLLADVAGLGLDLLLDLYPPRAPEFG
ncbi:DUF4279 domain-containing protein [Nocardia sp. NPDC052001]|uniref:DUF4279 domain-containing protein n=1 Tax=Nocardia sp. NPDC052001 TaxID=3154853 RepID=UPI0034131797